MHFLAKTSCSSKPHRGDGATAELCGNTILHVIPLKERQSLLPHHESFLLHSPILEPDFNLLVAEIKPVGQLSPSLPGYELIEHELALQFCQL